MGIHGNAEARGPQRRDNMSAHQSIHQRAAWVSVPIPSAHTAIAACTHTRLLQKRRRLIVLARVVDMSSDTTTATRDVDWSRAEDGVLIAGAGIAGLATAAALHKVGIPALVLERDPGPRLEGNAIALWPNAFRALDALGVAQPLRDEHVLLQRVELCSPDGAVLRGFSLDECEGAPHEFRGVRRAGLLKALTSQLPPGTVQYSCPIARVSSSDQGAAVELESGRTVKGRALLGADGTRSCVAATLGLQTPNYAGYSAYRGVAEFNGKLPIARDTVRQVLGRGVRAGMYPLSDSAVYWFIAMTCPAESSQLPRERYKDDCRSLIRGWNTDIVQAIERTPAEEITRNRIVDRWLVPGRSFGQGCITLAGDAVHPMTPNLGQGGCTALEDAIILAQSLRDAASPGGHSAGSGLAQLPAIAVESALREYEKARSWRTTKITVRSNLMGLVLGSDLPPVCAARNAFISKVLSPKHFMSHTQFDTGPL